MKLNEKLHILFDTDLAHLEARWFTLLLFASFQTEMFGYNTAIFTGLQYVLGGVPV